MVLCLFSFCNSFVSRIYIWQGYLQQILCLNRTEWLIKAFREACDWLLSKNLAMVLFFLLLYAIDLHNSFSMCQMEWYT